MVSANWVIGRHMPLVISHETRRKVWQAPTPYRLEI
jgi:hypothetical protein